ncbi:Dehydrodolichyl diphosphate synthase 2 [Glycine soja]|nr:Dehydrodolichyl diphosphate synthase 2 [Glycine soja]
MLSLTLPIPLLKTLTPPSPNINNPSLSSYSHYQPRSRSLTRGLIVPKHSSATAPRLPASAGHQAGVQPLRTVVRLCCSWGIQVLTVFVLSTENWFRPKVEVDSLMKLFETTINSSIACMKKEGIQIYVIGDSSKLPESLRSTIANAEKNTKHNSRLQLIVAMNYGGKYDVVQACKSVAKKVKDGLLHLDNINEKIIEKELETKCTEFPYPDLLIRAGGELRLSNFLLWQLAYTEFYFNKTPWPDFGKEEFVDALRSFQQRQRHYGGERHS